MQQVEEVEVMNVLKKIHGEVFIDVGAFVGKYTKLLANNFNKVIAIEPHPENFKQLCKNVGSLHNVITLNAAISDKVGTSKLYLSKDPQQHSLIPDQEVVIEDFKRNRIGSFILVRTLTIKHLVEKYNLKKIDLIKVDTEGCEKQVIRGSLDVIDMIDRWMIETHNPNDEKEIPELLQRYGYKVQLIPPYHVYAFRR